MPAPISPPEEKVLRLLWLKGPQAGARLGADPAIVRRLCEQALVMEVAPSTPKGRARLDLTERGRQVAAEVVPSNPTSADLFRALSALRDEVRALRAMLSSAQPGAESTSSPIPVEAIAAAHTQLESAIVAAARDLGRREHLGGVVPLPALREHLAHLAVPRSELDAALLAAEKEYVIDLKVANDPRSVRDASAGIQVDGRGLLYFVVAR